MLKYIGPSPSAERVQWNFICQYVSMLVCQWTLFLKNSSQGLSEILHDVRGFQVQKRPKERAYCSYGGRGRFSCKRTYVMFFFAGCYKIEARSFVVSYLRSGTFARKAKVPSSGPAASYVQRWAVCSNRLADV